MNYTKLVFHEGTWPDVLGKTLTIDFKRNEIELRSVEEGIKRIGGDVEMRKKKDLIESFIASLKPESNVDDDWNTFIAGKRKEELDKIIEDEKLNPEETRKFMENAFRDGFIQRSGTAITKILPPVSRFTPTGDRAKTRATVLEKLTAYFERFWNISDTPSQDDKQEMVYLD